MKGGGNDASTMYFQVPLAIGMFRWRIEDLYPPAKESWNSMVELDGLIQMNCFSVTTWKSANYIVRCVYMRMTDHKCTWSVGVTNLHVWILWCNLHIWILWCNSGAWHIWLHTGSNQSISFSLFSLRTSPSQPISFFFTTVFPHFI